MKNDMEILFDKIFKLEFDSFCRTLYPWKDVKFRNGKNIYQTTMREIYSGLGMTTKSDGGNDPTEIEKRNLSIAVYRANRGIRERISFLAERNDTPTLQDVLDICTFAGVTSKNKIEENNHTIDTAKNLFTKEANGYPCDLENYRKAKKNFISSLKKEGFDDRKIEKILITLDREFFQTSVLKKSLDVESLFRRDALMTRHGLFYNQMKLQRVNKLFEIQTNCEQSLHKHISFQKTLEIARYSARDSRQTIYNNDKTYPELDPIFWEYSKDNLIATKTYEI